MEKRDIIVIGGSAGSGAVLRRLAADLPGDFPASVFITAHVPSQAPPHLPSLLRDASGMRVSQAVDGQPVERGRIYVAPPNCHLLIIGETIRLGLGPRENLARPAIDPMFRSAALSYGARVIGVVLSGYLNDGASGLFAIKARGGITVAQHPVDAQVDQMPRAALERVEVDHVVAAADLGRLLVELAAQPAEATAPASEDLELEVRIALGARLGAEGLSGIAKPSPITCPHCSGVLSEIKGVGPLRYRCQTGHGFTAEAALAAQENAIDEALRIALRTIEERTSLVTRMGEDARAQGRTAVAELYEGRAREYEGYAVTLREAALASMRLAKDAGAGEG
jgi:two-component system, chemotaxis family, protein-glutamate methylesterase/glutaminase